MRRLIWVWCALSAYVPLLGFPDNNGLITCSKLFSLYVEGTQKLFITLFSITQFWIWIPKMYRLYKQEAHGLLCSPELNRDKFSINQQSLLSRGLLKDDCFQIILKSDSWFLTRRFFKFSIWISKTNWTQFTVPSFSRNMTAWAILVESDLRSFLPNSFWNLTTGLE